MEAAEEGCDRCRNMLPILSTLRQRGLLCDVALLCDDNTTFQVHSLLLTATSRLFYIHFVEHKPTLLQALSNQVLHIPNMPKDVLQVTLDFIYGSVPFEPENLDKLHEGAKIFDIELAKNFLSPTLYQHPGPTSSAGSVNRCPSFNIESNQVHIEQAVVKPEPPDSPQYSDNVESVWEHEDDIPLGMLPVRNRFFEEEEEEELGTLPCSTEINQNVHKVDDRNASKETSQVHADTVLSQEQSAPNGNRVKLELSMEQGNSEIAGTGETSDIGNSQGASSSSDSVPDLSNLENVEIHGSHTQFDPAVKETDAKFKTKSLGPEKLVSKTKTRTCRKSKVEVKSGRVAKTRRARRQKKPPQKKVPKTKLAKVRMPADSKEQIEDSQEYVVVQSVDKPVEEADGEEWDVKSDTLEQEDSGSDWEVELNIKPQTKAKKKTAGKKSATQKGKSSQMQVKGQPHRVKVQTLKDQPVTYTKSGRKRRTYSQMFYCQAEGCQYKNYGWHWVQSHMYHRHDIGEPDVACQLCEKKYFSKGQLQIHMRRVHLKNDTTAKNQQSLCQECGAIFSTPAALQIHCVKMHKKGKVFTCEDCEFKSPRKRDVQSHMVAIHNNIPRGVKVFQCPFCNYRCLDRVRYEDHEAKHTGIQKYLCTLCGKGYTTKRGMRLHLQYHSDERPYKCDQCDAAFKHSGKLRNHIRLCHTMRGVRPFGCNYCSFATTSRYNTSQHMKQKHPDQPVIVIDALAEQRRRHRPYVYTKLEGEGLEEVHDASNFNC